jgi:ribonuclease P protein component
MKLRSSLEFDRIYRQGRVYRGRLFAVHALPNASGGSRLGLSVSKKVGTAVTRNHVRRRLKEVFHSEVECLPANTDLVISARPAAAQASFEDLRKEFSRSLQRLKLKEHNSTGGA